MERFAGITRSTGPETQAVADGVPPITAIPVIVNRLAVVVVNTPELKFKLTAEIAELAATQEALLIVKVVAAVTPSPVTCGLEPANV